MLLIQGFVIIEDACQQEYKNKSVRTKFLDGYVRY